MANFHKLLRFFRRLATSNKPATLITLLYTAVLIFVVVHEYKTGFIPKNISIYQGLIRKNTRQFLARLTSRPEIISVKFNDQNLQRIITQRQDAISSGVYLAAQGSFVNARVSLNDGGEVRAEARLKGIFPEHWQDQRKWSLKIRLKQEGEILGMQQFSLMHPKTRDYIYEWLFAQALRNEGVIAPRIKYIKAAFNNVDQGIYILEEDVGKVLIESNKKREGPVVSFNKDVLIAKWARLGSVEHIIANESPDDFLNADIDIVYSTPQLTSQTQAAVTLLKSFQEGTLSTSEVFDTTTLAKFFAIKALFASSQFDPNDTRFYYNPITAKLEPIGSELAMSQRVGDWWLGLGSPRQDPFIDLFFQDEEFSSYYLQELKRVTDPSYLSGFLQSVDQELSENLKVIHTEFPEFIFETSLVSNNQKYISDILNPASALQAYILSTDQNTITVNVANKGYFPLFVSNIFLDDQVIASPLENKLIPPRASRQSIPKFSTYDFSVINQPSPDEVADLTLHFNILGLDQSLSVPISIWPFTDVATITTQSPYNSPNLHLFNFISINEFNEQIIISQGEWEINQTIIFPHGYSVIAGPGTILHLTQDSKIISYSPLMFQGSEIAPIIIDSPDSTGQGVVVLSAQNQSSLNHVVFNNLKSPLEHAWQLTGAVTFYQSDAEISNTVFEDIKAEDALNMILSQITLSNCSFKITSSDAFDGDFVTGSVKSCEFGSTTNDAIDVSGSKLSVENVFFSQIGDKAISVGEESSLSVSSSSFEDTNIAIASKDNSSVSLKDIVIASSKIGLVAFQKKPEFGPSSLEATDLSIKGTDTKYMIEKGSSATVDGKTVKPSYNNVKDLIYDNEDFTQ